MHEAAHFIDLSCRAFHNKVNKISFTIFEAPWNEISIFKDSADYNATEEKGKSKNTFAS
jgi:hypothetical protein